MTKTKKCKIDEVAKTHLILAAVLVAFLVPVIAVMIYGALGVNNLQNTSWHQVNTTIPTEYHIATIDSDSTSLHQFNPETGLYLLVWYGSYEPNSEECFVSWNHDNAVVFLYKEELNQLVFGDIVLIKDN